MSLPMRVARRARTARLVCACGRHQPRRLARVSVERLEVGSLLTTSPRAILLSQPEPHETIDLAQDLDTPGPAVEVAGSIGNGPAGAADVDWYHFHLNEAARGDLEVSTLPGSARFASILSLYNNDPQDYGDLYDLNGHRLMAQVGANSSDGVAQETQDLGPGD